MNQFEPALQLEINNINWGTAIKMKLEQQGQLLGLAGYQAGASVEIDLAEEEIEGISIGANQHMSGLLVNPQDGLLHVLEATARPDLIGSQIGLSTYAELLTPGGVSAQELKACVATGRSMIYYLLDEIDIDSPYQTPRNFHHMGSQYRRVVIDSVVLFGEGYSPEQAK